MKKLSLKRESLTPLTSAELGAVNGGGADAPRTLNVDECVGTLFTHHSALDCLTRYGCA